MSEPHTLTEKQLYHRVWDKTFTFPHRVWQVLKLREECEHVLLLEGDGIDSRTHLYAIYPDGTCQVEPETGSPSS